jgi:hypothetical protein
MEPSNGYPDPGPIPAPEISYTTDGVMVEVTITADTDAPIYYTVDGSVPNGESAVYTGPFTLPYPCNIAAAAAYKLNGSRSETARLSFGETPCAMPAIEVKDMVLTLTHPEEEVNIYYTLDDTPAVTGGILYTGPIRLEQACKIRVIAGGGDYSMSPELELYCSENSVLLADVDPGNRMFHAVDNLIAMGIMSGMGDYCFNPEGKLTRGMLAALLYRCAGTDLGDSWEKTNSFRDVPDSAYYAEAVEWAYRNGLNLSGSSTEFAPGSGVTRRELLRVIKAYLKTLQIPASVEKVMSGSGVIKGNGFLLNPKSNVTRGEMAFALYGCITADAFAAYTKPVNRPFPLNMTWE